MTNTYEDKAAVLLRQCYGWVPLQMKIEISDAGFLDPENDRPSFTNEELAMLIVEMRHRASEEWDATVPREIVKKLEAMKKGLNKG